MLRNSLVFALLIVAVVPILGLFNSPILQGVEPEAPFYPDKSNLLVLRGVQGGEKSIQDKQEWQSRRKHILQNMQKVMGPLPSETKKVPLDPQYTEVVELGKYTRRKLTFAVEPGDRVHAYLLIPNNLSGKTAAVLCLHQTTKIGKSEPAGLGGLPNLHYAAELAEHGFVALAVDYPNFGEYVFDPYSHGYVSATMKGIWNHMRSVDFLQSLPEVNPEQIGVIGHSLGGHNSLFVASFDQRIKCVVSSCGFNSFFRYYGGDLKGWSHKGYMPRIMELYEAKPGKMPFDFTEIVASLAPRPFLAIAPIGDSNFDVQGVKDCMQAAEPVYRLFGAEKNLQALHPNAGHDFPPEEREKAYLWMEQHLRGK